MKCICSKIVFLALAAALAFAGSSSPSAASTGTTTTATNVSSSFNPSYPGASVTFSASISPSVLDGETVTFYDGATSIGTGTTSGSQASLTTAALTAGSHSITATYAGDSSSIGSTSAKLIQTVTKETMTVSVSSNNNPSIPGASVTFTVNIYPSVPSGENITFYDGSTAIGTAATNSAGAATLTTSSLAAGSHSITASYPGDAGRLSGTSSAITQVVSKAATSMTILSNQNPSYPGQPVTFYARIYTAGQGQVPSGETVTFYDGGTAIGTGGTVADSYGGVAVALFTTSSLSAGSHIISAGYGGDATYSTCSSSTSGTLTQVVSKQSTTTSISSSFNPSFPGGSVTFTASISPYAQNGEIVTFYDGGTSIGTATTYNSRAQFSTSVLAAGSHTITATYAGDASSLSSTSPALSQSVTKQPTTTSISSSNNPSTPSSSVTFNASIYTQSGAGIPNGEIVTFYDGSTAIGTRGTVNGYASLTTSALALGSHTITASYPGDTGSLSSTSSALTQTVSKQATPTTVYSSSNPSGAGVAVTFTAIVGSNVPNGETITFYDGGTSIGTATTAYVSYPYYTEGAQLTTSSLAIGSHSITASYPGDASNLSSTSSAITQTISKLATTTTISSGPNPAYPTQSVTITASVWNSASPVPDGETVTFYDASTSIGTGTTSGGTATLTTSTLTAGSHSITASYPGDSSNLASTSSALTQTIAKLATTIFVFSSLNPSTPGASVTFTANIYGATVPDGETVTFYDGGAAIGTGTTSTSSASFTTSTLTTANHTITATYAGDAGRMTSTSSPLTQTVSSSTKATAISVAAAYNPSYVGGPETFTANISSQSGGVPDYQTVTFYDGSTAIGSDIMYGYQVSITTSALTLGTHSITAKYPGDTNYSASTSAALTVTIVKQSTTTTVSSSLNPSYPGASVSFAAYVNGPVPDGETVTFYDGSTSIGTANTSANSAILATSALAAGSHSITAAYPGDANYASSTSSALTQTVSKQATTTSVASNVNPSYPGQSVTFTASISLSIGGTVPDGETVTFYDGSTSLGTGPTYSNGTAQFTTSALTAGGHSITAKYAGDTISQTSTSSAITQSVVKESTTTSVSSTINPSYPGQTVTFTATVNTSASGPVADGETVTFYDGSTSIGTGLTYANGFAQLTTASLAIGIHNITAKYPGDTTNLTSTSGILTQTVAKFTTTTSVSASLNPSYPGGAVTFTAIVSPTAPSGETITFYDGSTSIGTGTIFNFYNYSYGAWVQGAQITTSSLSTGSHTITASYPGDTSALASTSSAMTQTVAKQATTTAVSSSFNPSYPGNPVTFTATITSSLGGPIPNGELVTFYDGSTVIGSCGTNNAAAQLTISSLAVGGHSITASYPGDASSLSSTSAALTETIAKVSSTTTVSSNWNPSVVGGGVAFTAIISSQPGVTIPDGETVTFYDGGTVIGTGTTGYVGNGYNSATGAQLTTTALALGSHTITATYAGDAGIMASTSSALTQTVTKQTTTTYLSSSLDPSYPGAGVTFTATISTKVPYGETVTFYDGGTSIGTGMTYMTGSYYTGYKYVATFATSTLAAGSHSITASYPGDASNFASTSNALSQAVGKQTTSTTVTSSLNPSAAGGTVTLSAMVTPELGPIPDGETVTFYDGSSSIGTGWTSNGAAQFTTSTLAKGSHSITASYPGDAGSLTSTSSALTQVVNSGTATTTTISSVFTEAPYGAPVTFVAKVSPSVPNTEELVFYDGSKFIGCSPVTGGVASFTTSSLAVGAHAIASGYTGDANYAPSSSTPITITVNPVAAGSTYVLWNNSGTAALWNIPSTGSQTSASFGPYSGWAPIGLGSDIGGNAYILWNHTADNQAQVSKITPSLTLAAYQTFGPYTGWTAKSIAGGPDGNVHILWNGPSNQASIYTVALGSSTTTQAYGPYSGWQAQQIAMDAYNNTWVLWSNTTSYQGALWCIDTDGNVSSQLFGSYAGWQPQYLAVGLDWMPRILWNYTSTNEVSLFTVPWEYSGFTSEVFGPYSGWTPAGMTVNNSGDSELAWNNTSNQLSIFDIGSTGTYTSKAYGPYTGYRAIGIAAGP